MKVVTFLIGLLLVAFGLGLVIKNWDILVPMVKALGGIVLALVGLVMMFSVGFRQ